MINEHLIYSPYLFNFFEFMAGNVGAAGQIQKDQL